MKIIYQPKGRAREYSPLALNLYTGCEHGCAYCYAPRCLFKKKEYFHNIQTARKNVLSLLEKDLQELQEKHCKERVLLCFTTDPYQRENEFNIITRKALGLFSAYGVHFQVLTKGGTKACRDFDLYSKGDAFASTLTFYDKDKSLEIEPKAAIPQDRIKALQEAHKNSIETWVSFEPVLDAEEVYKLLDCTHDFVDLYKVGKCSGYKTNVRWKEFAYTIVDKLEKYGKNYYIKEDLKACM